jgi:hypothetical protein
MSDSYTFQGKVLAVLPREEFNSGFCKQTVVVTDPDDKYPQEIPFEFYKVSCDLLNKVKRGDMVQVSFNLKGNEYKGRYFPALNGWKIVVHSSSRSDSIEEDVPPVNDPSDPLSESPF